MATPIPENEATFTLDEIVEATGATVEREGRSPDVVGVVTDSRAAREGALFVALRGETHDGHEHVRAACEAGARAVLVEREVAAPEGVAVLLVEDTLEALGALAGHHRGRLDVPFVAITGSVGKTSTKEMVAAALRGIGRRPLATRGNLNNRIGVPMTLLTLDGTHDVAVIEIGMSVPGEIARLAAMARPDVALVTAIEAVHTEGVGSIDGVRREKGALLEAARGGTAIFRDRDAMDEHAEGAHVLRFGRSDDADVRLVEVTLDAEALVTRATVVIGGREVALSLPLIGEAAAINATAALAVIHALAPESVDAAAKALSDVERVGGRMAAVPIEGGALVLDDTYNASPASVSAALSAAAELARARGGRLVAVLGDMLELGVDEAAMHAEVGRLAVERGAARLIVCGERMRDAGRAAITASMDAAQRTKVVLLKNVDDAAGCVTEDLEPADVVLVKGSRGMRMERVVVALEGGAA